MKLEKHEIQDNMHFKVIKPFMAYNQYINLEIPLDTTLTRITIRDNIVNFLMLESNRILSCSYDAFKHCTVFYKKDIVPTFRFVYRKYLNTNYYRLLLYNDKNRIIMTHIFLRILQMTREEYNHLLLSLGAQLITEYDVDEVKEYEYIGFVEEENAKKAAEYLNDKYITMIALLYYS